LRAGALEKRIKRHVIGRSREFYVSVSPGIEPICVEELARLGIGADGLNMPEKGGVSFSGHVHDCYSANLHLRTANRILMRVANFHAENFRGLEKKVRDMAWELYLCPGMPMEISVKSRHSRLFHTDAVAGSVREGIEAGLSSQNDKPCGPALNQAAIQRIFVRAIDDTFTISLDSSGELLHKRGLKIHGGRAPIRETLSAAILFMAGFRPGDLLIDPMCGSGTFSLEAAMISSQIPAGWFRDFAFMHWPCFRRPRWDYMRKIAGGKMSALNEPVVFASDIDGTAVKGLNQALESGGLLKSVCLRQKDFFDLTPPVTPDKSGGPAKGLVVINPPYGRRMSTKKQGIELFSSIGEKLSADFKNWRVALLAPDRRWAGQLPFPVRSFPLFHGGLHLSLFLGRIPEK